jgi:hypothetical protein
MIEAGVKWIHEYDRSILPDKMPPKKQKPTKTVVIERVVTTKETRTEYKSEPKTKPTHGECYRCGRDIHWKPDCYACTDVYGNELDSDDD